MKDQALEIAIKALHKIQLPDYVIRDDGGVSIYQTLSTRMGWAKEAEKQIEEMTGLNFYELKN